MAAIDKRTLALALKGTNEDLKNHFFRTMSSRAVEMLKEDVESLGPVRSRDVIKAQTEIVATARQLEAEGKIILKGEANEEFLVPGYRCACVDQCERNKTSSGPSAGE
jgi:flagellar motor switch protein FliG